jgi:hypothetical protein
VDTIKSAFQCRERARVGLDFAPLNPADGRDGYATRRRAELLPRESKQSAAVAQHFSDRPLRNHLVPDVRHAKHSDARAP